MLKYLICVSILLTGYFTVPYCIWKNVSEVDKPLLNCDDILRDYQNNLKQVLSKSTRGRNDEQSRENGDRGEGNNEGSEWNNQRGKKQKPKQIVRIGLLFPKQIADCAPLMEPVQGIVAELAISDINANDTLLSEFHLELVTIPSYVKCNRVFDTLGYAYVLKYNYTVDAIIGPACGDRTSGQSVATFAASENLPVISVASFSDELNRVDKYPTFTRIQESSVIQANYHAGIYEYFKWKTVAIIKELPSEKRVKNKCTEKYGNLAGALREKNYTVSVSSVLGSGELENGTSISNLISTYRVISIFANPLLTRNLILQFYRTCLNTTGCDWSDYRIITMNFQIGTVENNTQIIPWQCDQSNRLRMWKACLCCNKKERAYDAEAKLAFKSVIQLVNDYPKFEEQRIFQCRIMEKIVPISSKIRPKIGCIEGVYLWQHTYDSVLLYAHALNHTKNVRDGRALTEAIKQLKSSVQGQTGRIVTNPIGSRYMDVLAYFLLEPDDGEMTNILKLVPDMFGNFTARLVGKTSPRRVSDTPPCKWSDIKCGKLKTILISGGVAVFLIIVLCTAVSIWFDVKYGPDNVFILSEEDLKKLQQSKGKRITITDTDLRVSTKDKVTMQTLRELRNIHHTNIVNFLHCCVEPATLVIVTETCSKGLLHDLILSEEKVRTPAFVKSFALDIIKGLSYLHASVFHYHGSLTSLNCLVDTRWNIKLTGFYHKDLVQHYYQSEYYKNTSSQDYMEMELWDEDMIGKGLYGSLWMSPEYLKNSISNYEGYRANDIFSFGVIMYQLLHGTGPYGIVIEQDRDIGKLINQQIVKIKGGLTPSVLMMSEDAISKSESYNDERRSTLTPHIRITDEQHGAGKEEVYLTNCEGDPTEDKGVLADYEGILADFNDIASAYSDTISEVSSELRSESNTPDTDIIRRVCFECTNPDPNNRPNVKSLIADIERGSQSFLGTVLDQWLITLEKRSAALQEEFDHKNEDVRREKEKTKSLVYSLLPREIAEQKMNGQPVSPQFFSNCSFFFSDIKGFTKIVADLPGGPMDVVTMLDDLYSIMDEAIGKYKVVKVETIGDAYVVVSGLPTPHINGTMHAKEIASFALEVISTTSDIKVKQLNNRPVYMRIGIHSGGCVAGVVGKTMFHYCIYGNEPRYANSLESSGEASRIHMSNAMRRILDHSYHSQFKFFERKPAVHISGFRKKPTFWLTGESGVDRKMPDDEVYQNTSSKRNVSNASITNTTLRGIAKLKAETFGYSAGKRIRAMSDTISVSSSKSKANSESDVCGKAEKQDPSQSQK